MQQLLPDGSRAAGANGALRQWRQVLPILLLGSLCTAGSAHATEAAEQLNRSNDAPPKGLAAMEQGLGIVLMPIPVKNPTVGTGLGLVTLLTYDLDEGQSPPSSTALVAGYTDNKSWVAGVQQSFFWGHDRFRLDLVAGRGEANLKYFGREGGIDLSDNPIGYRLSGWYLQPRFLVRLTKSWYAGIHATYLDARTGLNVTLPGISAIELDTRLAGIGPVLNLDSRDNRFNPRQGWHAELLALNYDGRWGSAFEYQKYKFFVNHYLPLGASTTLALQANGVLSNGRIPFFDQPSLALRGFPAGRYQDKQMLATQGELRWRFADRWSAVGFAGVGKVAPDTDAFGDADLIFSKGLGIRYRASRRDDVNVGTDYAVGPDDEALYFRVGEAF